MRNNLHLLGQLKDSLINNDNFNETMGYFFTHFGGNDEFLRLGVRQKSRLIEKMITDTATSSLGQPAIVQHFSVCRLAQQKFCHGPCRINGKHASFFYFEDIRTGMLAIVLGNGETRYSRITAVAIREEPSAKWN